MLRRFAAPAAQCCRRCCFLYIYVEFLQAAKIVLAFLQIMLYDKGKIFSGASE